MRWVVDGLNVIGSRPDGWWRDRRAAVRRLVAALDEFAAQRGDSVTLFLDGRPFPLTPGGVDVHFAPGGRNAADDALVQWLSEQPPPQRDGLRAVTSDATLAARIGALGVPVDGARGFREALER
ncbi:MAG TPA: RNA-binding protein [Solirubrobacteraceae bacterium]|jgi:hypothetical protein|nr:RNA-binding protein [Solirubrobacteraceae bacterium]